MIKVQLQKQIDLLNARENRGTGRGVPVTEIARKTGIHRATLHRILSDPSVNVTTHHLNSLCEFFGCDLTDLVEYAPDAQSE